MKRLTGSVGLSGVVGYCPQQAWIQNATLRENVLFGQPFDQQRYDEAIRVAALERDLTQLPDGDLTEIGEKGINLSGGQKQRVNLARAVYFGADTVLLDDPLSAVDAHVAQHLFDELILGALHGRTRLLVTHQLHFLPRVEYVVLLKDGEIAEQGTYQELMAQEGELARLVKAHVVTEEQQQSPPAAAESKSSPSAPAAPTVDPNAAASASVTKKEKDTAAATTTTPASPTSAAGGPSKTKPLMTAEERATGGVSGEMYMYYFKAMGSGWVLILLFASVVFAQLARVAMDVWLAAWSSSKYDISTIAYRVVFALLGITQGAIVMGATSLGAKAGSDAALNLHDRSFSKVLRAPTSFFDTTPIGRVLNRFSKDQDVIDSMLPETMRGLLNMMLTAVSTLVLICAVSPWFTLALVPIVFLYYYTQQVYRPTSRELRRLDNLCRSPLFAHFSETLTGLPTIRAYKQQPLFIQTNLQRLNVSTQPYFLWNICQRWLWVRLDLCGGLIVFFSALVPVINRSSTETGLAGLSISYAISITTTLMWMVRQTVEAEGQMNSVERCKFYAEQIQEEAPAEMPADQSLPPRWPERGLVQYRHVSMRYREELPLVLQELTADIQPQERIGIVGRTGAGKSSLVSLLFRVVEPAGGSIDIDGVTTSSLGLRTLRSRLAIIPQDPVLFSGTLRSNLDPFDHHSDTDVWAALQRAHLKETVTKMDKQLLSTVNEGGDNWSVGQRCQICLARALLRNASVLVMDEATASVDMETDAFIQDSLRQHFGGTLITIAHRLNTIIDYDRVMVLDHGRLVEYASPAELLRNPSSIFSSMVANTGEHSNRTLRALAEQAEALRARGVRSGLSARLLITNGEGEAEGASQNAAAEETGAAPIIRQLHIHI